MSRAETRTGPLYFDATQVALSAPERDVLYAVAEHQLLASPYAELRGDEELLVTVGRLERIGFIRPTEITFEGGVLRLCARLTGAGETFLVRMPLGSMPESE